MDGGVVSFMIFWSVVGATVLFVLAARRFRRSSWP
jgi:hypothetical protein